MIFFLIILLLVVFLAAIYASLSAADRKVLLSKRRTLQFNDLARTYRIHVPVKIRENPHLIIAFHGYKSNAWQMAYLSGLHNSTDDNTIVVYPDSSKPTKRGQKPGWNAGFCCGCGWVNKVDDVGFTQKLIKTITKQYGVDPKHIYAAGFSNGAMFVQRLAAEQPQLFRAYASVSGSIGTQKTNLKPHKPVAMLLVHGEKDTLVPFNGGQGSTDSSFSWKSFEETKKVWKKNNSTYEPVSAVTYQNLGHAWPGWRIINFWHKKTAGSELVVNFFKTNT